MIFFKDVSGTIVHVGIVESIEGRTINTIEGNSSDMVRSKSYDIESERIAGYGRPRYDGYEQEQDTETDPGENIIEKKYNAEVTIRYKDNKPINFRIDLL